jgi:hypothetical protein
MLSRVFCLGNEINLSILLSNQPPLSVHIRRFIAPGIYSLINPALGRRERAFLANKDGANATPRG